jgi:pimeloyl-ACP methyl ester carboxylesterase
MQADTPVLAADGTELALQRVTPEEPGVGELAGAPPLVLLHGLTATRRYVVMGSRLLERSGCEVVSYDARGHGESAPAACRDPAVRASDAAAIRDALAAGDARAARVTLDVESELHEAYGYRRLALDLRDVLDALGIERAAFAGASMGAHTIARFALDHPQRVAAIALITPAYDADAHEARGDADYASWDALAQGLRDGGVEGFLAAYDFASVPEVWRATVEQVVRQRLAAHLHPDAVADALEAVPRSRPFEAMAQLAEIEAPTLIVGSRDAADPGHPLATAERYAATIPNGELLVEPDGASPLAWQGGQLSRAVGDLLGRV